MQDSDCHDCASSRCLVSAARDDVLHNLLLGSLRDLNDNRNRFVPRTVLISTIDSAKVSALLSNLGQYSSVETKRMVDIISPRDGTKCFCESSICTGLRRIFAVLVTLGKEHLILGFCNASPQICDSTSPYRDITPDPLSDSVLGRVLGSWQPKERGLFSHLQWEMRSPYLKKLASPSKQYLVFDDEISLPWTDVWMEDEKVDGQVSYVQRIKIHRDHHELGDPEEFFALKVIEKGSFLRAAQCSFRNEVAGNQRVAHGHITPILASFQHRQRFHIIFPWAEGGNLQELWKHKKPLELFHGKPASTYFSDWMANQCFSIADAVATIHGKASVADGQCFEPQLHFDIKPENILCFTNPQGKIPLYQLRLTDFGMALPINGESTIPRSKIVQTKSYRPPEGDMAGSLVGQKWDVWCLGCLYLEFITWGFLGWVGIEEFMDARLADLDEDEMDSDIPPIQEDVFFGKTSLRPKWRIWTKEAPRLVTKVKTSVSNQIRKLKAHPDCTEMFGEFLTFIENRMLVISVQDRAASDEVRDFLQGKWESLTCFEEEQ